ncbi:DUF3696 domain-containing protein [Enterococcus sp. BWR-S5]|uniref:DUF3696 domain-containing protein n=1 Tax=Enterococcus sp. BWR-S5 TaxID=2787714 RepID=UPI0019226125|nr:DUF3696 domain-containing protein [Enterococcus sp. BWR-S5]MBL1225239.1 AAA family ATPase [Enterococcus sp. BWR-S5]
MIKTITIQDFKCYRNLQLECKKINLITGINSSGKSTIIQSLLLFANQEKSGDYDLRNNPYGLDFVSFENIINKNNDDAEKIVIEINDVKREFKEKINERSQQSFSNMAVVNPIEEELRVLYVSADREISATQTESQIVDCYLPSKKNQHIGHFLHIDDAIVNNDVMENLTGYLKDIGLIKNKIEVKTGLNYYSIRIDGIEIAHVGMGIRYVLPILLTCLTNKDTVICIENPEIHLHPKAQVNLLLSLFNICEKNNNQLFIETHSDHVLNAFRVYVKEHAEQADESKIFFVDSDADVKSIAISEQGKLANNYPDFFDELQKQLVKLI